MAVTIVRDLRFRDHDPGPHHPERPERLTAIERALAESTLEVSFLEPRAATHEELARVHDEDYLQRLSLAAGRTQRFDEDTLTSTASVDSAYLAAGASVDLATRVARKEAPPGIALVRPPGHHATRDRAMGFCLLNNVAIAARALITEGSAKRVAIYDWDIHHGNGTQDIFYEDGCVLYLSTHQWPFYPGTGSRDETGRGPGEGTTLNVPLPAGTDDQTLLSVTREILAPRVRDFAPDMILVSAGFDAFELDPLGQFRVTVEGFGALAGEWRELAESVCGGRIAAVLEGGYHLDGLGRSVRRMLEVWAGVE